MSKKAFSKVLLAIPLATTVFMAGLATNDAQASESSQAPSKVMQFSVPDDGFNAETLIDQLKPLGFNKVYAVKEKGGFFHLMAKTHAGDIKRMWIGKSDGRAAIF